MKPSAGLLFAETMDSIDRAKQQIRAIISKSSVPEDPRHADNVLEWLLKLNPDADEALQIAALSHDIDRADEETKIKRADFNDYDQFKVAHAHHSATILRHILQQCQVEQSIVDAACQLVEQHEVGGDPRSDLLKDADSISYFEVNMPLYFQREGYKETLKRCIWGYQRLSPKMKEVCQNLTYSHDVLNKILKETVSNKNQVF